MTPPRPHRPGACRALLEELFAYLDGDLTLARRRALEAHLDACPCCDDLAANLRAAMAVCRAQGREQLPARVRARAQRRITALLEGRPMARRPRRT